jgi:hypothetical protein
VVADRRRDGRGRPLVAGEVGLRQQLVLAVVGQQQAALADVRSEKGLVGDLSNRCRQKRR